MQVARSTPNWIVAIVALGAALYWLRPILAPFALALVLWLIIDSLSGAIRRRISVIPSWVALVCSLLLVLGFASLVMFVFADNIGPVIASASTLQPRLDALAIELQRSLGIGGAPWSVNALITQIEPAALLGGIAATVQSIVANGTLILLYLLFIFPAAAAYSRKLPALAPEPEDRIRTDLVLGAIRRSIQNYFMVQTTISLIISVLSYATLAVIGLPHPLFWTFVIFFLNYIPNIGSIAAVLLPTLFALIQFEDWRYAVAVAIGLHVWQFGIGTFIQPRMTGASVNVSTLVVVISLALWGMLWGVTGVFLAVPLTVMLMLVLEQFPSTHWIAVLLSANGRPAPLMHPKPSEDR